MNCPYCGTPVEGLDARGPDQHTFDPCGCSAATQTPRDLAVSEPRALTDGGLTADNVLDACDICGENQGVKEEDVVNEETGEMATAWLCPECLDRARRYNAGEEDAFEEVA
ncbi:hypothetical protein [Halorussus amylolyticus]|uniref:hypothetical protein n=1 Tax=Halorussus amylolyticus TaxID=1126242 RepID=UPI00104DACAB|nr:hypothetical protein [Halorussus amylolyticus]